MKELIKKPVFWLAVYSFIVSVCLVLSLANCYYHECKKREIPEITKEYIEQIKNITNAETINDIDSLFIKLYGFEPN